MKATFLKITKYFLRFVLFLVALFFLLALLIQVPAVQNFVVDAATKVLSKKLNTHISIGYIDIDFPQTVVLDDLYIEDQKKDTLLYVGRAYIDVPIMPLLSNEVYLDAALENGLINIHRQLPDTVFNYQFLLDALTTTDTSTAAAPWLVGVSELQLRQIRANYQDEVEKMEATAFLGAFKTAINEVDLGKEIVNIELVELTDGQVQYAILEKDSSSFLKKTPPTATDPKAVDSLAQNIPFELPDISWNINVQKIKIANTDIAYNDYNVAPIPKGLDYSHLDIQEANIDIENLKFNNFTGGLDIHQLALKSGDEWQLDQFTTSISFDSTQLQVQNFELHTPQTHIINQTVLQYSDYGTLLNDPAASLLLNTTFKNAQLAVDDVFYLIPDLANLENVEPESRAILKIDGVLSGRLDSLKADGLSIEIGKETAIVSDFLIQGLPDYETANFDFLLKKLSSSYQDIERLSRNLGLPKGLAKWGTFHLKGHFKGSLANFKAENVDFATSSDTHFKGDARLKGILEYETANFDINVQKLSTSYRDLEGLDSSSSIPKDLAKWGKLRLNGQFSGSLADLTMKNVHFTTTKSNTHFKGDAAIKGVLDYETAIFKLDIQSLNTHPNDLIGFVPEEQWVQIEPLGNTNFSGIFDGTIHEFDLDGTLTTDAGNIDADIFAEFNADYTEAAYSGNVKFRQLQAGKLSQQPDLGGVNGSIALNGSGMSLESLNTNVGLFLDDVWYNGYRYQNIVVDGDMANQRFMGKVTIKDANARLHLNAQADFNPTLPIVEFTAAIDTLNLQPLNLYEEALALKTKIQGKLSGDSADNLDGWVSVNQLAVRQDSFYYELDTLHFEADQDHPTKKEIIVDAGFLKADMKGDFQLSSIPDLLASFTEYYFSTRPADLTMSDDEVPLFIKTDQEFTLNFAVTDPIALSRIFFPSLTQLDTIDFKGAIKSREQDLKVDLQIPGFVYDEFKFKKLTLKAFADTAKFRINATIDSLEYGNSIVVPQTIMKGNLWQDSLAFDFRLKTDTSAYSRFGWSGYVTREDDIYRLSFTDELDINNSRWAVAPDNAILIGSKSLYIQDFVVQKDDQRIAISSTTFDEDYPPIQVGFSNFSINELSDLIAYTGIDVKGLINGNVVLKDWMTNAYFESDLSILDMEVNDTELGDLKVLARQASQSPKIEMDINLKGENNNLGLEGFYKYDDGQIELDADIQNIELQAIEAFLSDMVKNSAGYVAGNLKIRGNIDAPLVNGKIRFQNANTHINYLQTHYALSNKDILIDNQAITFNKWSLTDSLQQTAVLDGKVYHQNLDNIRFDLHFHTDRFQFLNTKAKDNPLYYGKVFLKLYADITGTIEDPKVAMTAKTLPETVFYVVPFAETEGVISQEDYVIFLDPKEYDIEALRAGYEGDLAKDKSLAKVDSILQAKLQQSYEAQAAGIDLSLNFELTDETELHVIIDPITGDQVTCWGNAQLAIDIDKQGNIEMVGDYTIKNGVYSLSYEEIIRKKFDIQIGSRIDFTGNPFDASFNITALYKVATTTYPLIKSQSVNLSDEELKAAQSRSNVWVLLKIRGSLAEPEISFDIQLPDESQNVLNSTITRKLNQLKEDEVELNKQVFGLLLFGGFISEESNGGNLGDAGASTALSSVSNLITQQLNKLTERFVKGVDLNIGLESYTSDYGSPSGTESIVTELQLGVSKELFNDRVKVTVGSNVNLNTDNDAETSALSGITGDFAIEYKLTKDGQYQIRFFRKSDFDALQQSNNSKTGITIFLQKSF